MKTFTQLNEELKVTATSDVNPGNAVTLGVMNHYTPVQNIITNVRNLFCPILGCVVCDGEDGVSVKIHSTKFVNKEEISKLLYQPVYNNLSLSDYIMQQGLDFIKMVNIGQYWIVYFCPRDIPQANPAEIPASTATAIADAPCTEQVTDEVELDTLNEGHDDEEIESVTRKKIIELITAKNRVKAAKQIELLVNQQMELPREYYFSAVKAQDGKESIALRWKYTKRNSPDSDTEITKSLLNIFGTGDKAVFVADFDKGSMFKLPNEVKTLIDNILELLGAEKTSDKAVFKISDSEKKDDDKEQNDDNSEDNSSKDTGDDLTGGDEKKDNSSKEDDDDTRGDKSDDLLG